MIPRQRYDIQAHAPCVDKAYLAWIRTFPCIVCGRRRNVEACHTPGERGLGQKTSDRRTVPMCRIHHLEQTRIGWKAFIRIYELDLEWWIARLSAKPKLKKSKHEGYWIEYNQGRIYLGPVLIARFSAGIRERCREWLIDNVFTER